MWRAGPCANWFFGENVEPFGLGQSSVPLGRGKGRQCDIAYVDNCFIVVSVFLLLPPNDDIIYKVTREEVRGNPSLS